MRFTLIAFALLAAVTAARADDLLQVWAQARAADPLLRQAAALAGAQDASAREARAALLPQWRLQSSELRESGGARWNVTTSSLSQALIDAAQAVVYIPTRGCLNLAATVNVVLYDRAAKNPATQTGDSVIRQSRDTNNTLKLGGK